VQREDGVVVVPLSREERGQLGRVEVGFQRADVLVDLGDVESLALAG